MIYEEPNHEELVEQLGPVRLGQEAGERNLPRPDAGSDAHERPITDLLMQIRDRNEETLHGLLAENDRALHEELSYPWRQLMDEVVTATEGELEQQLAGDVLREERSDLLRRRDDLQRFRREHDLRSEANYPNAGQHRWTVVLIVVLLILESFLNATFLAAGSAQGLFGGWTLAIGFSLVNIGASLWPFGAWIRHVHHVQPLHQAWGWTAGSIWFALMLSLNLMLGHFREASAAAADDPLLNIGTAAWSAFRASPLGLTETQSWLVTGLGLFLASLALYKGYSWDDRYPRYGKMHRAFSAAQDRFLTITEDTVRLLGDVRQDAVARIEEIAEKVRGQPVRLTGIRKTRARTIRLYNEMLDRLEVVGSGIIAEYREANHSARHDEEVPVCHREKWTLGVRPVAVETGDSGPSGYTPVRPDDLQRAQQEACERIQKSYEGHKRALRHADERGAHPGVLGAGARTRPPRAAAGAGPSASGRSEPETRLYRVPPSEAPAAGPSAGGPGSAR